jgi:putative nucleotidyltransferase with HDIG domain
MFAILLRLKRFVAAYFRSHVARWSRSSTFRRWRVVIQIGLALLVAVLSIVLFPRPELFVPPDYPREGDIASQDIVAPFDFPVVKTAEELAADSVRKLRETPPVLEYDSEIADSVQRTLRQFLDHAERLAVTSIKPQLRAERLASAYPWLDLSALPPPRSNGGWLALRYAAEDVVHRLYTVGIFPDNRWLPKSQSPFVIVHRENEDVPLIRDQIFDLESANDRLRRELAEIPGVDSLEQHAFVEVVGSLLADNLRPDQETTDLRRQEALAEISPYKVRIYRGERIVSKNERVNAVHAERLRALARFRAERGDRSNPMWSIAPIGGRLLYALFCLAGMAFHFIYFRRRLLKRTSPIVLLTVVWILVLVASRFAHEAGGPALYLIPIPFAAILVTVLLDLGTGLVSTVFLSVLVGVVTGFNFSVFSIGLAAGMVSAYSVRTVRRRYDFYRPALYGALVYVVGSFVLETLRFAEVPILLASAGYGFINAVAGSVIAMGILPVFESLLGFTTDLTLLELSNLNHPLLRRLSLEAPGTYHHSIIIGNLAEAAAESIGANALLTRVGAYFHDIGKMEKPEYFVENQRHIKSRHEKLPPSMSALILESHVKRGHDLALEYDIPDSVIDFIDQHHGTTTMSYFYHKAQRQATVEPVSEEEFSYPGPKPQNRETAIVMLADSVEAVSRTLEDPKPGRLRSAIRKVIETKFTAGQLEECNLTLRDLHKIEESFLKILLGVFHTRIEYPSEKETRKLKEHRPSEETTEAEGEGDTEETEPLGEADRSRV